MLNMIQGAVVPDKALLSEGYEVIRAIRGLMPMSERISFCHCLRHFYMHIEMNRYFLFWKCHVTRRRRGRREAMKRVRCTKISIIWTVWTRRRHSQFSGKKGNF